MLEAVTDECGKEDPPPPAFVGGVKL